MSRSRRDGKKRGAHERWRYNMASREVGSRRFPARVASGPEGKRVTHRYERRTGVQQIADAIMREHDEPLRWLGDQ